MHVPRSSTPTDPQCPTIFNTQVLPSALPMASASVIENISGLNHAAHTLAVYASQRGLPQRHARLASGCWSALPGGVRYPQGPIDRFQFSFILLSQASPGALVSVYVWSTREAAAEGRLPITVPNPAHSQFISRETQEPVTPTEALSATRVRQLLSLPEGDSPIACRDRAILKFYLYSGVRIGTGCRLKVEDFLDDDEDPRVLIQEKGRGKSKRKLGINVLAADALREYIVAGNIGMTPSNESSAYESPTARNRAQWTYNGTTKTHP